MSSLKDAGTTGARTNWRDEILFSDDLESEGLKRLKEAIKLAKSLASVPESSKYKKTAQTGARVKVATSQP